MADSSDSMSHDDTVLPTLLEVDHADLTEVCVGLTETVLILTRTVKELQSQYLELRRRIPVIPIGVSHVQQNISQA